MMMQQSHNRETYDDERVGRQSKIETNQQEEKLNSTWGIQHDESLLLFVNLHILNYKKNKIKKKKRGNFL
jgi:hypothetical protein